MDHEVKNYIKENARHTYGLVNVLKYDVDELRKNVHDFNLDKIDENVNDAYDTLHKLSMMLEELRYAIHLIRNWES